MAKRKRKNNALTAQKRGRRKFFFSSPKLHFNKLFPGRIENLLNPKTLLIIGLVFIMLGGAHKIYALTQPTFEGRVPVKVVLGTYPPVGIEIPSVSIQLPVESMFLQNKVWGISEKGVSHLATSSNPGIEGNIILYGHNTLDRLGKLQGIEIGDKIYLESAIGKKFTYSVVKIMVVEPTDIAKLNEFDGEMISIYTCTGFADLKRLLVKAQRINDSLDPQISY